VSRKANGETRERLGQSAKRSAAVHGRRSEGELQWQADVCRVCDRAESQDFFACQVLGKITGRSASRAAVCCASSFMCATNVEIPAELSIFKK
jgi:hypothetical protein